MINDCEIACENVAEMKLAATNPPFSVHFNSMLNIS